VDDFIRVKVLNCEGYFVYLFGKNVSRGVTSDSSRLTNLMHKLTCASFSRVSELRY
jgi:hypothetical protein